MFGVIALIAALIIGTQAISRLLYASASETEVLRAMGAPPAATMMDGLLGVVGAVVAGALLAAAVAIALSPLTLFGPVRTVEPSPGIDADGAVLGSGLLALALVLSLVALVIAYRLAPHRAARRARAAGRGSVVVAAALAAGLPTSGGAGLRSLDQIAGQINRDSRTPQVESVIGNIGQYLNFVSVLPVQRPAEIVNYRTMGAMPAVLAGGLAAGAVAAVGLTLTASVRRRRRDFALLKTLGFTRRQLGSAVAWQSSVIAVIGLVIGVPLGIAAGRWLWVAFARELSAVPDPVIPAGSIALAAVAALVLANLVAAIPGRRAARTPAAEVLRSE